MKLNLSNSKFNNTNNNLANFDKKKFFFFKNSKNLDLFNNKDTYDFFKTFKKNQFDKKKIFEKPLNIIFHKTKILFFNEEFNLFKIFPKNYPNNIKKKIFFLNHNVFNFDNYFTSLSQTNKNSSEISYIKNSQQNNSEKFFFNYGPFHNLYNLFKKKFFKKNSYFLEKYDNPELNFNINDDFILISSWGGSKKKNTNSICKTLLNIKYIKSLSNYIVNDFFLFFSIYSETPKILNFDLEKNHINLFFKIKVTIHLLRITFLQYFNINFETHKKINRFFLILKSFSTLNYIWFLEYNILIFLIKIKVSNSLVYSHFLIKHNFIFSNKIVYFNKWSYLPTNSYIQCIISEWSFFKLLSFIFKLNDFVDHISFNRYKISDFLRNKNSNCLKYYQLKFLFFKYLETDYKCLTFIPLPISNYRLYYNYILLTWFNYWNHKIITWKFMS